jgi:hypothetical protein
MKKIINFFIFFFGLIAAVFYTLFYIQNKVLVPVRITFDQPALCLLPLIVLVSIVFGMILCGIFVLSYRLNKSSETSGRVGLPGNSVVLNEPEGAAEVHSIGPRRSVELDLEKENSNGNSFYVEYKKCKREIDDLFNSIQNKAQLS